MENADVKSIQFCKKTTVQPGAELPGTFGNKGPLWTRTAAGTKDVAPRAQVAQWHLVGDAADTRRGLTTHPAP